MKEILYLGTLILVACGGDEIAAWSDVSASEDGGHIDGGTADAAQNGRSAGGAAMAGGAGPGSASGGRSASTGGSNAGGGAGTLGRGGDANPSDSGSGGGGTGGQRPLDDAGDAFDSGAVDGGGPDACGPRLVWYADEDGDGYGTSANVVVACNAPSQGTWSRTLGDCSDEEVDVHPGQTRYFGRPYTTAAGASSFDYDCSGSEQGDGTQMPAPASCGLLALTLCGGTGYTKTERIGPGIDTLCGSQVLATCRAALAILLCEAVTETAAEPYRCH